MYVKILPGETYIRKMIKSIGRRWNPARKLWELPYQDIETLGLNHRISHDKK